MAANGPPDAAMPASDPSTAHDRRVAGWLTTLGTLTMAVGAALWAATGTDIDTAAGAGTISEYLVAVGESRALLIANLSTWIGGVLVIAAGGGGPEVRTSARQPRSSVRFPADVWRHTPQLAGAIPPSARMRMENAPAS